MRTAEFDFTLPSELIAQVPARERTASRLLRLDGRHGTLHDALFCELPQYLRPDDLLVLNDTQVIKARLFGVKERGGKIEVMIERVQDESHVLAFIRASHAPRPGSRLTLESEIHAIVEACCNGLYSLHFENTEPVFNLLERFGRLPLPPYINHAPVPLDETRYQTVYASQAGAVAAPTAGLHFDQAMLAQLANQGVGTAYITLHVGAGTFQPVRVETLAEHKMHRERYTVPQRTVEAIATAKAKGGRIMAVGTTSLRALESAAIGGELRAGHGETAIFITPGYRFKVVERLLTNFHLPKSTLLMLVSAFAGTDNIRNAYRHAVESRYRFFSYGDAMLLERQ